MFRPDHLHWRGAQRKGGAPPKLFPKQSQDKLPPWRHLSPHLRYLADQKNPMFTMLKSVYMCAPEIPIGVMYGEAELALSSLESYKGVRNESATVSMMNSTFIASSLACF